jgi:hypothetical protein
MAGVRVVSSLPKMYFVDGGLGVVTIKMNSPRNLAQVHACKLCTGTLCSIPCQSEPTSEGAQCRARGTVRARQQVAS